MLHDWQLFFLLKVDDDFILSSGYCNNVKFRCCISFFRDLMLHMHGFARYFDERIFFQSNITRNIHKFCDGSFLCVELCFQNFILCMLHMYNM